MGCCLVDVLLHGRQLKSNSLLVPIGRCVGALRRGERLTVHGDVEISYRAISSEYLQQIISLTNRPGSAIPQELRRYAVVLPPEETGLRGAIGIRFNREPRIGDSVKRVLSDAFKKFETFPEDSPAVVWLAFTDLPSVIPWESAADDPILGSVAIRRKLSDY